jgi:microcystin-dependent protein
MCVALLIIIVIMIICFLRNSKENFRFNVSSASSMVLTDSDGNLSSIPFPKGIVVIWSGNLADIPKGWALCDGTQGTPDLRGRFVLGVNPSDNKNNLTARPMKTTGGAETHTLKTEEMPSHTHDIIGKGDDAGYCKSGQCGFWPTDRWTNDAVVKASTSGGKLVVENTGGDLPHNNMPPYFALAYIMKM